MFLFFVFGLVPQHDSYGEKGDRAEQPSSEHSEHGGGCVVGIHGIVIV